MSINNFNIFYCDDLEWSDNIDYEYQVWCDLKQYYDIGETTFVPFKYYNELARDILENNDQNEALLNLRNENGEIKFACAIVLGLDYEQINRR
jgi:hypothetical protein